MYSVYEEIRYLRFLTVIILKLNCVIFKIMSPKDTERLANSADSPRSVFSLRVCTVCSDLSVLAWQQILFHQI